MKSLKLLFAFCFFLFPPSPWGEGMGVRCFAQTPGEWTWMSGNNTPNSLGVFGTQGVPNPANAPPGFYEPCEWKDNNGNFWLYGGLDVGFDVHGALWKFDPAITQWTWMKGSSFPGQAGFYGTQGVPSATDHPGGRAFGTATWTDLSGNLWLFGGGFNGQRFNDLWKYTIATNEWTWMKGPNVGGNPGSYGTKGVPSATNLPPQRFETSCCWTDKAGNLWLYGGQTIAGIYGDLWKYDITTNQWTWMHGANTLNAVPVYGTQGTAAPANTPGARLVYASWIDVGGNLWLFGGGHSSVKNNDLWKYDIATNQWTWMKGPNTTNNAGSYGTKCVTATTNVPPARFENRARVQDTCGNFWHFGGAGPPGGGFLNDLWHYNTTTNQWTWVSGDNTGNQAAVYGTKGVSAPANKPGGRFGSVAWMDNNGFIWVYGGGGTGSTYYNDLFRFVPDPTCVPSSAAVVTPSSNTTICIGQSATLSATGTTSYVWSAGGQTTSGIVVSPTTTSTYTVIGNNFCGSDTSTVTVTVNLPPAVAITGNDTICAGDNAVLNASGGGNYSWNTGQTDASITVNPPSTSTYTSTVSVGTCSVAASFMVTVQPAPVPTASNNVTIITGSNTTLNSSSTPSGVTYSWSPATGLSCITCQNPVATPTTTTEYCVTVTDSNSCTGTACVLVTIIPEPPPDCSGEIYLPNAFSPNLDNENDVLQLYFTDERCITSMELIIYDRWGEKVFVTTNPAAAWDGSYQGERMNTAVFAYYLEVTLTTGELIMKKGNISLIR